MKIGEINTATFRAKCLFTLIAILNIVVTFFQSGTGGIIVQIILGILLVCGNDIARILFIIGSILGIFFGIFVRISDTVSIFKIDVYFVFLWYIVFLHFVYLRIIKMF